MFVVPAATLSDASAGESVRLDGPEGRHAVSVRRLTAGERVDLVDGEGRRATGVIAEVVDRSSAVVLVQSVHAEDPPRPRIVVVQALPKGDRGELAVELLTEVGVDEIVPWAAANCVTRWRPDRVDRSHRRWGDAALAAAKQARRSWFPLIAPLASTADVLRIIGSADTSLVLHEHGHERIAASTLPDDGVVAVIVGPEGGLTEDELEAMSAAGAQIVRMGPTVLRTSSAGIAAVAALLAPSRRWALADEQGMGG